MRKHLNAYDRALMQVDERLLGLGELTCRRLTEALLSLVERDGERARAVIAGDDEIDAADEALEMEALYLISLQQPEDRDLRSLAAVMRISRDLERIGDYACDIAEITLALLDKGPYFKPLIDVPRMGNLVLAMMTKSLKAHLEKDLDTARRLHDEDAGVDRLFVALGEELTGYMKRGPDYVDQASGLLLVARYLERIGDHVVNISEMTIFAATGERHPFKRHQPGGNG